MKITNLFATIAGKTLTTELDDVNVLSARLSSMVTGHTDIFGNTDLQDATLRYEYDAYDANQSSKSQLNNKEVSSILAKGNLLNMQTMLAVVL